MNLLGITLQTTNEEELEENYMCSCKLLKVLTKYQLPEEVQYLQYNRSGYFELK